MFSQTSQASHIKGKNFHQEPIEEGVLALRTRGGESCLLRAAFLSLEDRGVYWMVDGEKSEDKGGNFLFFFRIVTFSKCMESKGRTDGERGVLAEKISKETCKDGSAKEGEVTRLRGGEETV